MNDLYEITTHAQSALELRELENLVRAIGEERGAPEDDAAIEEWRSRALPELDFEPVVEDVDLARDSYNKYKLVHEGPQRTYRSHLHLSSAWGTGDLAQRVVAIVQVALDRIAAGRTRAFIQRARQNGDLTGRRRKSRPFPHPLPYASPPPTTAEGRYAEEAGLVAAAFHFPLSRPVPGISLYVTRFDKPKTDGTWTRGRAPTDQYNYERNLVIRLNAKALNEATYDNDEWSGVVAHELMHNLGWGHGVGEYSKKLAIETYEWAVTRTSPAGLAK